MITAGKPQKSEAKKSASKAQHTHQHQAPDMPLHTDDEDEGEDKGKDKGEDNIDTIVPTKKKSTDRSRISEVSMGKAESQHDKTNVKESAQEHKKAKASEASEEEDDTDRDSGDQAGEDPSGSSSSDSRLEELEKKTGALEALFEAEVRSSTRDASLRHYHHDASAISHSYRACYLPAGSDVG